MGLNLAYNNYLVLKFIADIVFGPCVCAPVCACVCVQQTTEKWPVKKKTKTSVFKTSCLHLSYHLSIGFTVNHWLLRA